VRREAEALVVLLAALRRAEQGARHFWGKKRKKNETN
jgi:hypothetical protein